MENNPQKKVHRIHSVNIFVMPKPHLNGDRIEVLVRLEGELEQYYRPLFISEAMIQLGPSFVLKTIFRIVLEAFSEAYAKKFAPPGESQEKGPGE